MNPPDPPDEREARRLARGFARILRVPATTITPEAVARVQRIWRVAFERLDRLHLSGDTDEDFWSQLRDGLLAGGATDNDLCGAAAFFVTFVVENTKPHSEERDWQFDLICQHLCRSKMVIKIGRDDSFISVEFPDRTVH